LVKWFAGRPGAGGDVWNMMRLIYNHSGFGLIELTVLVIVLGILTAVTMQSMTAAVQDLRRVKTEREMEILARAIVGNPDETVQGIRSDFGYIGDIGAFPPSLQALYRNPGGLATWDGPYLPPGFVQDSVGLATDEWGRPYLYGGGTVITSTGSGQPITRRLADAAADYLLNSLSGTIRDANDSLPGAIYRDSVDVKISVPDGLGAILTKTYRPSAAGAFRLDSLPAGQHLMRIIYRPEVDTLLRYVTILPRHKSTSDFKFAAAHFSASAGGGCDSSGFIALRPDGVGSTTRLTASGGCADNWECVDDITPDDNITMVQSQGGNWRTDIYSLSSPWSNICNIYSVSVHCRALKAALWTVGRAKLVLRTYGTDYEGPENTVSSSWTEYSSEWATNPATGLAWTWDEIEQLEAGLSLQTSSPASRVQCTQVWVDVAYGP